MTRKLIQNPRFEKVYKKLYEKEKLFIDEAIEEIISNPKIGEVKKGDLSGVYVHNFKIRNQQLLLAYQWDDKEIVLLYVGPHENFYRDLKRDN